MTGLVQESKKRLQAQGGRMTAQRYLILQTLEELCDHPTAEELFALIRERDATLHLSTVYRTLRWLEQENLISARVFAEDRRQERYDAAYPIEHHHFVCTACKAVIEFDSPLMEGLKMEFEWRYGARVENSSTTLYGLCAACKDKEKNL
jgi:Fe2+ or Zn2+ uptake regulation protein